MSRAFSEVIVRALLMLGLFLANMGGCGGTVLPHSFNSPFTQLVTGVSSLLQAGESETNSRSRSVGLTPGMVNPSDAVADKSIASDDWSAVVGKNDLW
ncbi:hypothetical protein KAI87_10460 [Myxococcota bacterium]|nr:hypothetical protein [Myxococcota bacterium]